MKTENFGTPENISAEDQERMERLVHDAEGILFAKDVTQKIANEAEEEVGPERAKEHGEHILQGEAKEDIEFAEIEFDSLFANPASTKEIFGKLEQELGWTKSKWHAMVGVLRHALNELYYRARFPAPDERNPHPEGQTRDSRSVLLSIVADDYGAEVMRDIAPLVDIYVERARELVKESKWKDEDGEED